MSKLGYVRFFPIVKQIVVNSMIAIALHQPFFKQVSGIFKITSIHQLPLYLSDFLLQADSPIDFSCKHAECLILSEGAIKR